MLATTPAAGKWGTMEGPATTDSGDDDDSMGDGATVKPRWVNKALAACALGAGLFALGVVDATPAAADGTGPSRYESVIDDVQPDLDEVEVEIVGGDAFFQVTADEGTEVAIDGYDGEPYLRIDADGTVFENTRSPAA